jgi:hypothetical protein
VCDSGRYGSYIGAVAGGVGDQHLMVDTSSDRSPTKALLWRIVAIGRRF